MKRFMMGLLTLMLAGNVGATEKSETDKKADSVAVAIECSILNSYAKRDEESQRLRILALKQAREVVPILMASEAKGYINFGKDYKNNLDFWLGYFIATLTEQRGNVIRKAVYTDWQNTSPENNAILLLDMKNCNYIK